MHLLSRYFGIALRLSIAAAVVWFFILSVDYTKLGSHLQIDLVMAAMAMQVPMVLALLFYSRRHAILVRVPPIPLLPAVEAMILAAALNLVVPARLSEPVKAVYLRARLAVPLPNGLSAIMVERLFDLAVVGAIGMTGVVGVMMPNVWYLWALPAGAVVALVLIRPLSIAVLTRLHSPQSRLLGLVIRYCRHIARIMNGKIVVQTLLLTLASWIAHFVGIWLFFRIQPFGQLSIFEVATVFGAIIFAGAIPALPAGIGLFEAAVVVVLQPIGFEFHEALAVGIALHVGEILQAAVLGPVLMLYRSIGFSELMRDTTSMLRS